NENSDACEDESNPVEAARNNLRKSAVLVRRCMGVISNKPSFVVAFLDSFTSLDIRGMLLKTKLSKCFSFPFTINLVGRKVKKVLITIQTSFNRLSVVLFSSLPALGVNPKPI